ncbi:Jasmonate O-methyltransferase [Heracleum sosnowskyi]|uniref:Jasmonate O-methyltransferase n=1 Tax=Heracleum sosnowskyi TaxID=360622 RepID=A0AAD8MGW3_9APIA|nr:Jasmonate O-methyltransferase [Heracleum sosnowskyi]
MDVASVLHMNAANREFSYAKNSVIQKSVIVKAQKVLEDTIKDYGNQGFPECFKLADLGCASGPNSLSFVTNIIDNVNALCEQKDLKAPDEFQVFLNDLPSSFYARLFPRNSLHFVHSSSSLHWLSQVPDKLPDNNKGNVYIAKESPPGVFEAYLNQFKTDFTTFLHMRSEEIVSNGRLVLTLLGRSMADPISKDSSFTFELLAKSLEDMLVEGLLNEEDINSFNLPVYKPSVDELSAIIESEGSFSLDKLETIEVNLEKRDENGMVSSEDSIGMIVVKTVRAGLEPLVASHFGPALMDKLFERYAIHLTEHLSKEKIYYFNIVVSLTRKWN